MAANTPADTGLVLNDADDAPVPFHTTGSLPAARVQEPAAASNEALDELLPAIAWATSSYPAFGVRALLFAVTGVSFGVSRRERELRFVFCDLYRAAYDQLDPKGD